jgi:hypothetical protein
MESFWGRMQVELLNRRRWKTRIELAGAIHDYIELWHNPRRWHSALQMRTPDEVENAWVQVNGASTTAGPGQQERAAVGASARLRRAPSPTADITLGGDGSEPAVTITNDSRPSTASTQGDLTLFRWSR